MLAAAARSRHGRHAHGTLPLPAPATLELLRGAPVYGVEARAELVTPTGAAVVAGLACAFGALPALAWRRRLRRGDAGVAERPNVVRVLVGHARRRERRRLGARS